MSIINAHWSKICLAHPFKIWLDDIGHTTGGIAVRPRDPFHRNRINGMERRRGGDFGRKHSTFVVGFYIRFNVCTCFNTWKIIEHEKYISNYDMKNAEEYMFLLRLTSLGMIAAWLSSSSSGSSFVKPTHTTAHYVQNFAFFHVLSSKINLKYFE